VSRQHAELCPSGPLWLIADLASKNGTFVNGKRVTSAVLSRGDVLRIGDFVAVVVIGSRGTALHFQSFGHGIGGGHLHAGAVKFVEELARVDLPVVLEGETGTGKERFARALHATSGRKGPFLAVNCAVYSKAVAAGELFGYRRGAFTGADQASLGHIRAAEGGTLLLDELVELSLDVQAMLLRALENREVLPLGETRPVPIDVRLVAATQLPLTEAVAAGKFRPDLRARLEGGLLQLPPLRACREIVPELFCALFERHTGSKPELDAGAAELLCLHDWPLNVREIDTLARRIAVARPGGCGLSARVLASSGLRTEHRSTCGAPSHRKEIGVPGRRPHDEPYDPRHVQALLAALAGHRGNVSKAAQAVGISRPKAYRILRTMKSSA